MAEYTPMMQQYLAIKADYKDAFLFFRLGDFYEMFFEDAVQASNALEITLTSREGGIGERIPMCGVPYHAAQGYIEQLVNLGYKVAICEQTEDPKQAKGVVRREVVQLITPGTVMEGKSLLEKENNFLASISSFPDDTYGIALTDLTTGENRVTLLSKNIEDVFGEIYANGVKEVVVSSSLEEDIQKQIIERCNVTISFEDLNDINESFIMLVKQLDDEKLKVTFGRLLQYLIKTQKRSLSHLQPVKVYSVNQFMKIDFFSKRNLELTETIRGKGKKGSLLWLLDQTVTAMGGRLLKQWVDRPLLNKADIEARLNLVQTFLDQYFERLELRDLLKEVYDLERLAGRVAFGNVNAKDLIQLKKSLMQVPEIYKLVNDLKHPYAKSLSEKMDLCESLTHLLEQSIKENPPLSIKDGDIINDGYNETLDQYRYASRNGKTWIASLEKEEREKTGIKSLKIGYNRIFGYYIEVTKANLHLLPEGMYERKQTLANAERYITPELKEKETLILEAEEKSIQLEYDIFIDIREQVKEYIPRLQSLAKIIAELDVLQCFATVSEERHYCKPVFSKNEIFIRDGRHPVVEKVMNSQEYVPNDCLMKEGRSVLLITGPNMSGKSTYMRQVALTAILAQIGCFVPATEAVLPIYDQVFTRIGAADDLISGQSTFMVEMLEAKNAIVNATENSLILFDEIGRGTSTYDGMALAQAIIEYIHQHIGAHTLFSTHYHELTELENELTNLINVHVRAIEENEKVVFLHKIKEGAADQSYGIHVAQLAELPIKLINRAREILDKLEQNEQQPKTNVRLDHTPDTGQLSFFGEDRTVIKEALSISNKEKQLLDSIKEIDILDLTPIEALNKLYEIQKKLKS
ncbi:DNA mismatch repair protein MutS [Fredinandcohnia quinoae]|uniref:DNA mismatch repair protein MutS n=1 Tax=Fredinandcohnia quinoae TaxID=2918902 RepID=A0AAW5DSN7_9BACI|nr:DNA mismatch repair protein MutS [Fredinandcohnia sp. SECRCQ15]MCH1623700.1 DNA mismatch repair protein MutS [Fredinandcohnia sp. SECRCQ15]